MKNLLLKAALFCGLFAFLSPAVAQTWTQMTNAPADYWISAASSADGAKLYSASWMGNIVASTNSGVTWNTKYSNQFINLYPAACSPDGTKVVVADFKGTILYSGDSGATWSGLGNFGWWWGVACSADANLIVGVSQGSPRTGFIESPTNYPGIWSKRGWPENPSPYSNFSVSNNLPLEPWEAVACSTDGTKIVAVGIGAVFTTTDSGATWNQQALDYINLDWSSVASSADGTKLVAIASGQIYTSSSSGAGWTLTSAPTANWIQVASSADGTRLVGVIYGGGIYNSVDSGATWRLDNAPNMYWAAVASSAAGRKLVAVVYGGGIYTTELPPLYSAMSANPQRVPTGTNIQVVLTVENNDTNAITNIVVSGGIVVTGAGGTSLVTDNGTTMLTQLAPGQSTSFTNIYQATNSGNVTFTATVQGTSVAGPEPDSICSSQGLIVPNGDLLIKRAVESADLYAGSGVFQTVPITPQVKTNIVANTNDLSTFQVQIQNNDPHTQTFTLLAGEGGNLVWKRTFLLAGADVTAQVEAPGGMTLPPMAPGTTLTLNVIVQDTNASPGDLNVVEFALGLASDTSLFLDTVEAVTQLVPVILVNSTGDLPMLDSNGCCCDTGRTLTNGVAECTLRAAIQLANRNAGKDIIKFQIPASDTNHDGGVPLIQPATPLPLITDPVIIDGWSQDPNAATPPVELNGKLIPRPSKPPYSATPFDIPIWAGAASGLNFQGANNEIRGLVINQFPLCGLVLASASGGQNIVQGNFIGTDPTGNYGLANGHNGYRAIPYANKGAGILITSSGNFIGGTGPRDGNVISSSSGAIWADTADGYPGSQVDKGAVGGLGICLLNPGAGTNFIQGNKIGVNANGKSRIKSAADRTAVGGFMTAGVFVQDAPYNLVGGAEAGAGNVISGNAIGVWVLDVSATGNQIAGNIIGPLADGRTGAAFSMEIGVAIEGASGNQIGGSDAAAGNLLAFNNEAISLRAQANQTLIQNNLIGVQSDGVSPLENVRGIVASGQSDLAFSGTVIPENAITLLIEPNTGSFNSEPTSAILSGQTNYQGHPTGALILDNIVANCKEAGILAVSLDNSLIRGNSIYANSGNALNPGTSGGICVVSGTGIHISANSIHDNAGLGIDLDPAGPNPNQVAGLGGNPNDRQNYPVVNAFGGAMAGSGQIRIRGVLNTSVNGGIYTIEFFSSPNANPAGYGEGQTYLGSTNLNVGFSGYETIDSTLPFAGTATGWLTATATASDGSTSEFSPAVRITDCVPALKGTCPDDEKNVPDFKSGSPSQLASPRIPGGPSSGFGDGNGDGIQDYLQSNVASFQGFPGLWMTLAVTSGATLENVLSTGAPAVAGLPDGYVFPLGLLSFGITNLPASGSIIATNFLHLDVDTNFLYSATTWLNYGPTPDQAAPHWYEFAFNGTNGAEMLPDRIILHFQDGTRGDDDLAVNGQITAIGGPAMKLPVGPPLSVASDDTQILGAATNGLLRSLGITNNLLLTTVVLSWPASYTNYVIQTASGPAANDWRTLLEWPVLGANRFFVTNSGFAPAGFYRLVYVPNPAAALPPPIAPGY